MVQAVMGLGTYAGSQLRRGLQGGALVGGTARTWRTELQRWLSYTWPTGSMALWAVGLLGLILLSFYMW